MQDLNIDPEKKRDELIADTKQAENEAKQEQAAILEAVKNDEELTHESTEWVEIGDAEFKVKTTLAGDTLDIVEGFTADELPPMSSLVEAAALQTDSIRAGDSLVTEETDIQAFWEAYYNEYGEAAIEAIQARILSPAMENKGVPQSFQGEQRR